MNRIDELFARKESHVLSVYFTAGFPHLNDTVPIIRTLEKAGVDMIEIGIPFSDPLADGPVIQQSSQTALKNGMSLKVLFEQLRDIRKEVTVPLLLMGYLNPVLSMGMEAFCRQAAECGIDGVILPDLPLQEYEKKYKALYEKYHLHSIFLISPQTTAERIREIDRCGTGFNYLVSTYAVTGSAKNLQASVPYFRRIRDMYLQKPSLIGFGISSRETFRLACQYAHGAIIGSAFIKALAGEKSLEEKIHIFVESIL